MQKLLCRFERIYRSGSYLEGPETTRISSKQTQVDFATKIRSVSKDRFRKESLLFSSLSIIFKKTFVISFKSLPTLYPLTFLSIASFMIIGPLLSMMSIHIFFPESYQGDSSIILINSIGILAWLFISLYAQASLMFALTNKETGIVDALSMAFPRLLSYVVLILFMAIAVCLGRCCFWSPG